MKSIDQKPLIPSHHHPTLQVEREHYFKYQNDHPIENLKVSSYKQNKNSSKESARSRHSYGGYENQQTNINKLSNQKQSRNKE